MKAKDIYYNVFKEEFNGGNIYASIITTKLYHDTLVFTDILNGISQELRLEEGEYYNEDNEYVCTEDEMMIYD